MASPLIVACPVPFSPSEALTPPPGAPPAAVAPDPYSGEEGEYDHITAVLGWPPHLSSALKAQALSSSP